MWSLWMISDSASDVMLVPCVEGDNGIFPVVALVAWLVQSPAAELLPSVPSLLLCLFSGPLDSCGVGGSTMTGSVTREGVTETDASEGSWLG